MKKTITYHCIFCLVFLSVNIKAQNWSGLNTGLQRAVQTLYTDTIDNLLYVGGDFTFADGISAHSIAKWDGANWGSLSFGVTGCFNACNPVLGIIKYNGELYVGGAFNNMDGLDSTEYLAKWNGSNWQSIGIPPNSAVSDFYIYNNELYATGAFTSIGGVQASHIAKFNGSNWSVIDTTNFNDNIIAIGEYKGELYIAGAFNNNGLNRIAKWNGSKWLPVGNGFFGPWSGARDFEVYHDTLFIAGSFSKMDDPSNPGNFIVKWDGNNWYDAGGGVLGSIGNPELGTIFDLFIFNDELYAIGDFYFAGGVPAQRIAKWNGFEWCGLGNAFDNRVVALGAYKDTLYIGGGFTVIDGDTIKRIAKWTGGNYVDTCGAIVGNKEISPSKSKISISPNPTTGKITIQLPQNQSAETTIYNSLGVQLKKEKISPAANQVDLSQFPVGLYFLIVNISGQQQTMKIVKE